MAWIAFPRLRLLPIRLNRFGFWDKESMAEINDSATALEF